MLNEVLARVPDARTLAAADLPVPPAGLAELVGLVEKGTVSGKQAKEVFGRMWQERRGASEIVQAEGMSQVSDTAALEEACRRAIAAHPDEVARYRGRPRPAAGLLRRTGAQGDRRASQPESGQRDPA